MERVGRGRDRPTGGDRSGGPPDGDVAAVGERNDRDELLAGSRVQDERNVDMLAEALLPLARGRLAGQPPALEELG